MTVSGTRVHPGRVMAFELSIILPTFALGASLISGDPSAFEDGWPLVVWAVVVGLVELLPVPAWRGLTISVGFPLMMMVAFLYEPPAAAAVALVGASDPREFQREVTLLRALFNRCQVALSVLAASALFHALTDFDRNSDPDSEVILLIAAAG